MFVDRIRLLDESLQPIALRIGQFGKSCFAIALMAAEEIVTGAHGQAHEPMFERRLATKALQLLEGLEPDFLSDIFDFAFPPRVAAGRGKDARRVFLD